MNLLRGIDARAFSLEVQATDAICEADQANKFYASPGFRSFAGAYSFNNLIEQVRLRLAISFPSRKGVPG